MKLLNIFIFSLFYTQNAHAYFDPETGAFIVQAIITKKAEITFYLGYPIRLIKKIYQKIKSKLSKKKV